jgi:long-subunit fatty acid transport protein
LGYRTSLAENHSITIASAFQNNNFLDDQYKAGIEYSYQDMLFLRAGYDYSPPQSDFRENIFGATFGAGLRKDMGSVNVQFDYAYRSAKIFGANHVFSLTLGF